MAHLSSSSPWLPGKDKALAGWLWKWPMSEKVQPQLHPGRTWVSVAVFEGFAFTLLAELVHLHS